MSQFTRVPVSGFSKGSGVRVKKLLSLIKGTTYEQEIMDALAVTSIEGEIISINGASVLVQKVEEAKKKYTKFDLVSNFEDVTFTPNLQNSQNRNESIFQMSFANKDSISFPNDEDVSDEIKQLIATEDIHAEPAYDAQTQIFSKLFNFDRYANSLLEHRLVDYVDTNLKMIKNHYKGRKFIHSYRLLRQNDNGKYFFRATTSVRYKDYNIGVSVFIALIAMHKVMKTSQSNSEIKSFSHTESLISVFFENTKGEKVKDIGEVRFQVLLTNSEITSGAVKLSGMFSILVNIDGQIVALDAKKPDDNTRFKDTIVSISHGSSPESAIQKMEANNALKTVQDRLFVEIRKISTTRDTIMLRKIFVDRLLNSNNLSKSDATKAELNKLYNAQASTFSELLKLMGRAQLIVEKEGVDAKDYLKFIVYSVLTGPDNDPATNPAPGTGPATS